MPSNQMTDSGVQAGFERAGAIVKDVAERARDTVASYREGGVAQVTSWTTRGASR